MAQVGIILFNYLFTYLALTKQRPDFQAMKDEAEDKNCTYKNEDLFKKNQANEGTAVVLIPTSVEGDVVATALGDSQIRRTKAKRKTPSPPARSLGISSNQSIFSK